MENFKDKFQYYNGAESIEEMINLVEIAGQDKSKCYYIKFMNQFYAVFYNSMNHEIIMGQEKVFYMSNGQLHQIDIKSFKSEYKVTSRVNKDVTNTLARELLEIDNNIEVLYFPTIKSKTLTTPKKHIGNIYLVLLGVTFANIFYPVENLRGMGKYFILSREMNSFIRNTKGAIAIDPFKQLLKFEDGTIGKYAILTYGGYYGSKFGFALLSKNKYVEVKREWPSLTRYRAMYPDSFIEFSNDLRIDKTLCKNCNSSLPEGRTDYCCNDCFDEYTRDTVLNKTTAMLPYKILCRDNFQCKCGKDLATINRHKVRIPKNNGGEVHHIENVQNGGSDNEKNLKSFCFNCHRKQDHAKVKYVYSEAKVINLLSYIKHLDSTSTI